MGKNPGVGKTSASTRVTPTSVRVQGTSYGITQKRPQSSSVKIKSLNNDYTTYTETKVPVREDAR
ncbi:MAG: hypothetical protein HY553_03645 [Elusimicrobia bacterium]|nr:hypothetical protein [Elusimicrobiota bacterium]